MSDSAKAVKKHIWFLFTQRWKQSQSENNRWPPQMTFSKARRKTRGRPTLLADDQIWVKPRTPSEDYE